MEVGEGIGRIIIVDFGTSPKEITEVIESSSSRAFIDGGSMCAERRTLEDASSITSIALSGKNLSEIYLVVSVTAAFIASSLISTP